MAESVDLKPAGQAAHIAGSNDAPFVFFDSAPALGHANGIFSLLLSATRLGATTDGSVQSFASAVVQLQGNREALLSLRKAIDDALLLGTKPHGQAN